MRDELRIKNRSEAELGGANLELRIFKNEKREARIEITKFLNREGTRRTL